MPQPKPRALTALKGMFRMAGPRRSRRPARRHAPDRWSGRRCRAAECARPWPWPTSGRRRPRRPRSWSLTACHLGGLSSAGAAARLALVMPPSGEWCGRAERMRFARLIHRRSRVLGGPYGPRRLRRQSPPGLVATQGDAVGARSRSVVIRRSPPCRPVCGRLGGGLGARRPGKFVGIDPGVDGVQHRQPSVVNRPGRIVDRRRSIVLGPGSVVDGHVRVELAGRLSILAWRSSILAAASAFICAHLLRALAAAALASCWASLAAWSTSTSA